MAKSIALAADASRGAALLLIAYKRGCRLRRLARRAPRPRSSTDLVLAGPNFRRDFVPASKEEPAKVVGSDDEVLVVDREGAAGTHDGLEPSGACVATDRVSGALSDL